MKQEAKRGQHTSSRTRILALYGGEHVNFTYAFLRADLPIAVQAIQGGHAVQESSYRFGPIQGERFLIYLAVPNETAMFDAYEALSIKGVGVVAFRESDLSNQLTALATEPLPESRIKFLQHYPLWDPELTFATKGDAL